MGRAIRGDVERTLMRLDFLEPDEGRVKEYLGLINAGWSRRFNRESDGEE